MSFPNAFLACFGRRRRQAAVLTAALAVLAACGGGDAELDANASRAVLNDAAPGASTPVPTTGSSNSTATTSTEATTTTTTLPATEATTSTAQTATTRAPAPTIPSRPDSDGDLDVTEERIWRLEMGALANQGSPATQKFVDELSHTQAEALGLRLCAAVYDSRDTTAGIMTFATELITEVDDLNDDGLRITMAAAVALSKYLCNDLVDWDAVDELAKSFT